MTKILVILSIVLTVGLSNPSRAVAGESSALKARTYTGWAVIKRNAIDPKAQDDEWISMRDLSFTDTGTTLRLKDGDVDTRYSVELVVITYTQTDTTVLKLALYEDGNDRAISYIWGEPGADRLGMNLRWVQVGLTKQG